ncbi:hypothetical protein HDU93_001206 [Gonapodya sp. JEL0774]|nr:hypothetical protein HDU93_001206 [Gonapodya sp. JEL0774]
MGRQQRRGAPSKQGVDSSAIGKTDGGAKGDSAPQPFKATRAQQIFGFSAASLFLAIQFRGIVAILPKLVEPWFGTLLARYHVFPTCVALVIISWSFTYAYFFSRQYDVMPDHLISPAMWLCVIFALLLGGSPQLLEAGFVIGNLLADRISPQYGAYAMHCLITFPVIVVVGCLAGLAQFGALRLGHARNQRGSTYTAFSSSTAILIWFIINSQKYGPPKTVNSFERVAAMSAAGAGGFLLLAFLQSWARDRGAQAAFETLKAESEPVPTPIPSQDPSEVPKPQLTITTKMPFIFLALGLLWYNSNNNPHFVKGVVQNLHNAPSSNFTILARRESVTGFLSTVYLPDRATTIIRAGHSVIGGHAEYSEPGLEPETVFPAFHLHELGRLVKNRETGGNERALVIGLGVGTAAKGLAKLGVRVDAVEIDPAVVDMAREFFALDSANVTVRVRDGRESLQRGPRGIYDYVAHDVFTGGDAPARLVSVEAMLGVRRVLKKDGVLTLNIVAFQPSPTFTSVASTLAYTFPYVRCFRDNTPGSSPDGLRNYIFLASAHPLNLRPASALDIFSSETRRLALTNFPNWEIDIRSTVSGVTRPPQPDAKATDGQYMDFVRSGFGVVIPEKAKGSSRIGRLLTDEDPLTDDEGLKAAEEYWKLARVMFPDEFWWNY